MTIVQSRACLLVLLMIAAACIGWLLRPSESNPREQVPAERALDVDGAARLSGHARSSLPEQLDSPASEPTTLPRTLTVVGVVTDPTGRPVARAEVIVHGRISRVTQWLDAVVAASGVTHPDGTYTVRTSREYAELSIQAREIDEDVGASVPQVVNMPSEDTSELRIDCALLPGAELPVLVRDADDGSPVAGAAVGFTIGSDTTAAECGRQNTDAHGQCLLRCVPLPATIYVRGPGGGSTGRVVRAAPAGGASVEILVPSSSEAVALTFLTDSADRAGREVACTLLHDGTDWRFYQRFTAILGGPPSLVTTFRKCPAAWLAMRDVTGRRCELDWMALVGGSVRHVYVDVDQMAYVDLGFRAGEEGPPLDAQTLLVEASDTILGASARSMVSTDEEGLARTWLPAGQYRIEIAEKPVAVFDLPAANQQRFNFALLGFGSIRLRVLPPEDAGHLEVRVESRVRPTIAPAPAPMAERGGAHGSRTYSVEWPLTELESTRLVPWPVGTEVTVGIFSTGTGHPLVATPTKVGQDWLTLDARLQRTDVAVMVEVTHDGEVAKSGQVWFRDVTVYQQDSGGPPSEEVLSPFSYRADIDPASGRAELRVSPHATYSVYYWVPGTSGGFVLSSRGGHLPDGAMLCARALRIGQEPMDVSLTTQP